MLRLIHVNVPGKKIGNFFIILDNLFNEYEQIINVHISVIRNRINIGRYSKNAVHAHYTKIHHIMNRLIRWFGHGGWNQC